MYEVKRFSKFLDRLDEHSRMEAQRRLDRAVKIEQSKIDNVRVGSGVKGIKRYLKDNREANSEYLRSLLNND